MTDILSLAATANPDHAVALADRVWWVGQALPDDRFQCHVYLIEHGDQSVLLDPGSVLTFAQTLRKIEEVIPFNHIRYFVCHHQDPDITACLPLIDQISARRDAVILSHWRAIALLKHYGLGLPLSCVEERGWQLDLGGRMLKFVFTPYLHFPGAFCTFDQTSGLLFSSDIFGGFTDDFHLVAQDESQFDGVRVFHEHYMPSREILFNTLTKLEKLPITAIAPQHGSIIPANLVGFYFNQLKNTDCGLLQMTQTSSDVIRLSHLNKMLRSFMETMVLHRSFADIAGLLLAEIREILPISGFEFYAAVEGGQILHLAPESMYRGVIAEPAGDCRNLIGRTRQEWLAGHGEILVSSRADRSCRPAEPQSQTILILPLLTADRQTVRGLALMYFDAELEIDHETQQTLTQLSIPLSVAVEREMLQRMLEMEKQRFYEQSIRDYLTGLYTRVYMQESVRRLFAAHDRHPEVHISVIIFDLDHFKAINDTYGHNAGDEVLKQVAGIIMAATRGGDLQVRLGGEEFAVFLEVSEREVAVEIAERIRQNISRMKMGPPLETASFTISGGLAFRRPGENQLELLQRADQALYEAKNTGRNRICLARD
jgi:diguanylate cyclase (GGDEF)-like protein